MTSRPAEPDESSATPAQDAASARARRRDEIAQAAVQRDVLAERRDRAAEVRDDEAQRRRRALADSGRLPDWVAHDSQELADRAASSLDRIHAGRDRDAASGDLATLNELDRLERLAAAEILVVSDAEQAVVAAAMGSDRREEDELLPPASPAT